MSLVLNLKLTGRPSPCSRYSRQKRCRQRRPQLPTVSTTRGTQSHHDMKSNPFSWQKRGIRAHHVIFENYPILTCPKRNCPQYLDIHGQILDLIRPVQEQAQAVRENSCRRKTGSCRVHFADEGKMPQSVIMFFRVFVLFLQSTLCRFGQVVMQN